MKKILFNRLIIIVLLTSVFVLPLFYPTGIAIYFRLLLLILILTVSFKSFKIAFIDREVNRMTENLATVIFSVFVIFIILESIFMFIPRSHHLADTLASKLWYAKYWSPINSLDFRDNEPSNNKPVILFAGDSFTAGHGLKSVDDRFSNIVGKELNKKGRKYNIINIGVNGLDTRHEYDVMRRFFYLTRIKPEKIILQYSGNDIEGVAMANGLTSRFLPTDMNKIFTLVRSGSYLFNYIYWLYPREYLDISTSYVTFLQQAYKDDIILSKHKDDLRLFVNYARENSVQLIVVIFPFLTDLETSDSMYVNDTVNFFKADKINVINTSDLVKNIPVRERVVNENDSHPSKMVNMMVAREILKIIEQPVN